MKITHSTRPFEKEKITNPTTQIVREAMEIASKDVRAPKVVRDGLVKPSVELLSLQEVKELIGEVDVENEMISPYPKHMQNHVDWCNGYQRGYNQCLEDNKEKKYTKEDMLTIRNQLVTISSVAVELLIREKKVGNVTAWDMVQAVSKYTKWFDDYVESLYKPQTEWEVEWVDGKLKLK